MGKSSLILVFLFLLIPSMSFGITIDGDMSDWGITSWAGFNDPAHGGSPEGPGTPVTGHKNGVYFWEEDGVGSGGYVGPGWGGQSYDIEALYVTTDSYYLYMSLITGFWPNNQNYLGDIAIDLNSDGLYEYGIDTTTGLLFSGLDASQWKKVKYPQHYASNPESIINEEGEADDPVMGIGNGAPSDPLNNPINTGAFYYGTGSLNGDYSRYVIELKISLNDIQWNGHGMFHITQSCGNDAGDLNINPVPEPATLLLFGSGILAFFGFRRRKSS